MSTEPRTAVLSQPHHRPADIDIMDTHFDELCDLHGLLQGMFEHQGILDHSTNDRFVSMLTDVVNMFTVDQDAAEGVTDESDDE